MDELFASECHTILAELGTLLLQLEREGPGAPAQAECFRLFHTVKGMANLAGRPKMQELSHEAESLLAAGRTPPIPRLLATVDELGRLLRDPETPAPSFVQVDARRLDALLDLVGELSVAEARLRFEWRKGDARITEGTVRAVADLVRRVQSEVMAARLLDVAHLFQPAPRLARDVAAANGRRVEVLTDSGSLEVDRSVVDSLASVLGHLVQNAVMHGIEPPDARRARGKPEVGLLRLRARREEGTTVVEVEDDGAGVDAAKVRERAARLGLLRADDPDPLSMARAVELLFLDGFTTAEGTGRHAGRGVGLGVVRDTVVSLGGSLSFHATAGRGTRVELRLPPSVAVLDTLLVRTSEGIVALPTRNVEHIRPGADVVTVDGVPCIVHAARHVRVVARSASEATRAAEGKVVLLRSSQGAYGLSVVNVLGTHAAVLKALEPALRQREGALGATVLGDGTLALVLDPEKHAPAVVA